MRLRRYREARNISRQEAGDTIRASHAKISRLELGRIGFQLKDLINLCDLYDVTDHEERIILLGLARQANAPAWWSEFSDMIPSWFETYLGMEQAATLIRSYEVQFIPGLLQTADYALGVVGLGHVTDHDVNRRVELRMRRQEILHHNGPQLWAVIDEAALRRPIGGRAAMFRQLEHLIDVTELPNVTVQILPFAAGGHAAAGGPVTLLRLPGQELPDLVYLEQLTTAIYLDRRDDIDYYLHVLDRLGVQATPPAQTPLILRQILREL